MNKQKQQHSSFSLRVEFCERLAFAFTHPPTQGQSQPFRAGVRSSTAAANQCNYCGQFGHWRRSCYKLIAESKEKGQKAFQPTKFPGKAISYGQSSGAAATEGATGGI